MADRDVRVVYKSRILPRDYDDQDQDHGHRSRIPTALDPYDYPDSGRDLREARERREHDRERDHGSDGGRTATARSSRRSLQVDDRYSSRETFVEKDRSSRNSPRESQRTFAQDPDRSRQSSRGPDLRYRSSNLIEVDIDRSRSRNNGRDDVSGLRKEGNAYVMDARGEIDIIMPGRDRGREHEGRRPRSVYDSRRREYDQDDEWRIVDSVRETRLDDRPRSRARTRRETQSSEDSYVMISPTKAENPTVRSAIRRTNYTASETGRRRSRSISFRQKEIADHDCGDRRRERPGAEAQLSGTYLRSRLDDAGSEISTYSKARTPRRSGGEAYAAAVYRDRREDRDDRYQVPYPPQQGHRSRHRSRSRHKRREERDRQQDDDDDNYSERVEKTYIKETTYK